MSSGYDFGRLLAVPVGPPDAVELRDARTGERLVTLIAPNPLSIKAMTFTPDGERLAVACHGNNVQLWDLASLRRQLADIHLDWAEP